MSTETIYRVSQALSYEAISDTEYLVNGDEHAARTSDFRVVRGVGNTSVVTKRNLSNLQDTATFNITKRHSAFIITPTKAGAVQGIKYIVAKTAFGFNVSKIVEDTDELDETNQATSNQESLDAFDVGVLMCELDAEDDWDSLPTSPPRFTVPSAGTLPADMEAAIAARRSVNARRMLF
ncbi:uncharacterized protein PAC_17825 [Phialocephala subalpina]|uniref:Uncharacterized protein n=1 Tax=Phialocephala subalpina TaxID=576137 RepID=A0A1L7XS94_9HELO|nr:uncharacterized protein PAC_17825 [Phialocephala subalpina]